MDPSQLTDEQRKELDEKWKNTSPEEITELQKQQCIFCQIIAGKIPSKKIYEDNLCLAVMDINPAAKGHLLLLPKQHYSIMPQVPEEEIGHFFNIAKKLSQSLLRGLKVSGTNIFIANGSAAGQRAQHFLLHLIPRKEGDGLLPAEEKLIDKEMQKKVCVVIRDSLNKQLGIKLMEKKETEKVDTGDRDIPEDWEKEENQENKEERSESSEEPEENVEEKRRGSEDSNLDDIADLFR